MKSQNDYIFNLYKLRIDSKNRSSFISEGVNNLMISYHNEPGTLVMCVTHEDDIGEVNYIFELYRDDDSYKIHTSSSQFKSYAQFAQRAVKTEEYLRLKLNRSVINKDIVVKERDKYVVQLVEVTMDSDQMLKMSSKNSIANFVGNTEETHWVIVNLFSNKTDMQNNSIEESLRKYAKDYTIHYLKVDLMVGRNLKLE